MSIQAFFLHTNQDIPISLLREIHQLFTAHYPCRGQVEGRGAVDTIPIGPIISDYVRIYMCYLCFFIDVFKEL